MRTPRQISTRVTRTRLVLRFSPQECVQSSSWPWFIESAFSMLKSTFLAFISLFSTRPCTSAEPQQVTTINGEASPSVVRGSQNQEAIIDQVRPDGNRVLIMKGTRMPGKRVPIHIHKNSGITCIFTGMITDYMEGQLPQHFGPGDCFYMPANTPISAANLGETPVQFVDIFVLPEDEPAMTVIEKSQQSSPQ